LCPDRPLITAASCCRRTRGRRALKSSEEVIEILEAFDLTGTLRGAAQLVGCDHNGRTPLFGPPGVGVGWM
jgi:hypothetical protein